MTHLGTRSEAIGVRGNGLSGPLRHSIGRLSQLHL